MRRAAGVRNPGATTSLSPRSNRRGNVMVVLLVLMVLLAAFASAQVAVTQKDIRQSNFILSHSELYKYAATLRSITQGRAHHSRKLAGYEPAPNEVAQKVRQEREAAEKLGMQFVNIPVSAANMSEATAGQIHEAIRASRADGSVFVH